VFSRRPDITVLLTSNCSRVTFVQCPCNILWYRLFILCNHNNNNNNNNNNNKCVTRLTVEIMPQLWVRACLFKCVQLFAFVFEFVARFHSIVRCCIVTHSCKYIYKMHIYLTSIWAASYVAIMLTAVSNKSSIQKYVSIVGRDWTDTGLSQRTPTRPRLAYYLDVLNPKPITFTLRCLEVNVCRERKEVQI